MQVSAELAGLGVKCVVYYPKRGKTDLFSRLVTQLKQLNVEIVDSLPASLDDFAVCVDALFGFSFKGNPRPPFDQVLSKLCEVKKSCIVSVDIPSGWDVDQGPTGQTILIGSKSLNHFSN